MKKPPVPCMGGRGLTNTWVVSPCAEFVGQLFQVALSDLLTALNQPAPPR